MQQKILDGVNRKHRSTQGKCGISIVNLSHELGVKYDITTEIIKELYNDDLIEIRLGINDYLVFKKIRNEKTNIRNNCF